ncbi:hypothetical protein GFV12_06705 [Desulfurobacterium thermolithotrophum]|uniref:hypothetical protein n=1 Tax=Desulfurobacterium thermolithotrophum TaxID=64160 RepID=UPI0013D8AC75|nr:hypothetical protein [Desulfurobacterium thermolithotrophum]
MHGLTEKVDRLERAIMELVYIQHKTEMEIQSLKREMKEFKDAIQKDTENLKRELKEFKDEMKEFKDEMKEFKDEMKEFKDEMKKFKDEMEDFKDWAKKTIEENHEWSKREVKRMNKQWGELANKMGTIVEDIVFPATRPVIRKYFKCDPLDLMMNVERKREGEREEFDVVGACKDKVFLIEVKSSIRPEHVQQIKKKVERMFKFFPEYAGREIIPILASLSIKKEILNTLTKEGIYGMAYREWEYMDILNFEEVDLVK